MPFINYPSMMKVKGDIHPIALHVMILNKNVMNYKSYETQQNIP